MLCPNGHKEPLKKALFHSVEVDYCTECLGIWFDDDELREAKDDRDQQLNWLDFDIWRDKYKFTVTHGNRLCPKCRISLTRINYDNSKVKIEFCKSCQGVWLERGEFHQIINYLKQKLDYEILHHYVKALVVQLWEVFLGPGRFRDELEDFIMVLKLFKYKFMVQYPYVSMLIRELPQ